MAIFGREFFCLQPAGAAASTRHRPVPAERPGERTGPTPATASADPARPRPDPVGRTLPGRPDHESVLVGCPFHSLSLCLEIDRTCSTQAHRAWYEVSLHN